MQEGKVAFEWFERADYPNIRQVMDDKHRLPASFEDWEKSAEAGEQALANSRHIVVRTIIKSHAFAVWCREHEIKANAQSRLRYCKEQHANTAIETDGIGEPSVRIGEEAQMKSEAARGISIFGNSQRPGPILLKRSRCLVKRVMRGLRSLSRHPR